MNNLILKLHALPEHKQLDVLDDWADAIDKGSVGAGMTDAAKGDLGANDYDNFHSYARKHGGIEESVIRLVQWVKEEDEDEYNELLTELDEILSDS